ncbi:MAG: mechanosensitive ion channel, partial [Phycisphaerales bacterium]|nr:mechanosensitive ion channel [Phycisphaerales bacterium]
KRNASKNVDSARAELAAIAPVAKPDVGASKEQLETALKSAEAELAAARDQRDRIERDTQDRAARRKELPELIVAARRQLDEIARKLGQAPDPQAGSALVAAQRQRLQAERLATQARLEALQAESDGIDATTELSSVRRELAAKLFTRAEQAVKELRPVVDQRRQEEAAELQRKARTAAIEAAMQLPEVADLVKVNVAFADELSRTSRADSEAAAKLTESRRFLDALKRRFERGKEKIETIGLDAKAAQLLRAQRDALPDARELLAQIDARRDRIAEVDLRRIELDDEVEALLTIDDEVDELMASMPPSTPPDRLEAIRTFIIDALTERRQKYLEPLVEALDDLSTSLAGLNANDRETESIAEEYRSFIDERILWARSNRTYQIGDVVLAIDAFREDFATDRLSLSASALWKDVMSKPLGYLLVLALVLASVLRRSIRRNIRKYGEQVARASTDRFRFTIAVLGLTTLLAAHWPLVLWLLGTRLASVPGEEPLLWALAIALGNVAMLLFQLGWIVEAARGGGLAAAHFRIRSRPLRRIRLVFRSITWVVLPIAMAAVTARSLPETPGEVALARTCFIVAMLFMGGAQAMLWSPRSGMLAEWYAEHPERMAARLRYVTITASVAVYLCLALLSAIGYSYTAFFLYRRVSMTWLLALGLLLTLGVLLRWLSVTKRRIALAELERLRTAPVETEAGAPRMDEEGMGRLASISGQTRRLINSGMVIAALLGLWAIWSNLMPALSLLRTVELWEYTAIAPDGSPKQLPVTLAALLSAGVVAFLGTLAIRNGPGVIEFAVLSRIPMSASGRYAASAVTRYLIVMVVILAFASQIGIGWSQVQWLAAAISVGLGFGLKEIFENLVSGLVILFERPVRVGDTVTVGDVTGTVSKIRIRATTITDWDNKELLVPNRELITGRLVNWTLTDGRTRLVLPVGIAYGSDTALAERLLLEVARRNPRVLRDPAPTAVLTGFGDNCLDMSMRVFVENVGDMLSVRHELNRGIDQAFRDAGIEIAFPQRDLHFRGPLQVQVEAPTRLADERVTERAVAESGE